MGSRFNPGPGLPCPGSHYRQVSSQCVLVTWINTSMWPVDNCPTHIVRQSCQMYHQWRQSCQMSHQWISPLVDSNEDSSPSMVSNVDLWISSVELAQRPTHWAESKVTLPITLARQQRKIKLGVPVFQSPGKCYKTPVLLNFKLINI